jgi:hypothetical protein
MPPLARRPKNESPLDEDTAFGSSRQLLRNAGLARSGRSGDDQERSHVSHCGPLGTEPGCVRERCARFAPVACSDHDPPSKSHSTAGAANSAR